MSMLREVREIIERNEGDIGATLSVLDQMILIYSILRKGSSFYDSLACELVALKSEFQMELVEYNINK